MDLRRAILAQQDITYFTIVAGIGATLVSLTFVVGTFFLVDLLKRYDRVSFPVFRERNPEDERSLSRHSKHPQSLNDFELFDGDPLVVFIAFSLAVTWNLFLMPLAVGLTAAWGGAYLLVIAIELAAFCWILANSFKVREQKIARLCPYLTREERLWPVFARIGFGVYVVVILIVLISIFADVPVVHYLAFWHWFCVSDDLAAVFAIKTLCVISLLVGTYTTNKDMYIFFKTMAAERMRDKWLQDFIKDSYPALEHRVATYKARLPEKAVRDDEIVTLWNHGVPPIISTHDVIRQAGDTFTASLWEDLLRRKGTPAWMLDVPRIADWAANVESALERHRHAT